MKKIVLALAAAAAIAAGTLTVPTAADARGGRNAAIGLGVLGGVIVGGAIANSWGPRYAPAPGYVVYEGYGAGYPVACPGGFWARRPLFDRNGYQVGYSRPRFICP
jgi:hypothetical protein